MSNLSRLKTKISAADPSILNELPTLLEIIDALLTSKPIPADLADRLDAEGAQQGVSLWNISTSLRPSLDSSSENYRVFAFLRLTGYLLIEAGMEPKPNVEVTKTASSLAGCDELDYAERLLMRAAKFEEVLSKSQDASLERSKAASIVSYFSTRMEMEWRRENESVAYHMLGKASDNALLCQLSSEDIELLASKTLDIGKSILKAVSPEASKDINSQPGQPGPEAALEWLQRALLLVETASKGGTQNASLRRATLRGLARAHFQHSRNNQSSLDSAEETITELLADPEMKPEEIQQLRWMHLSILKRRKVSNERLEAAFKAITDNVSFNEMNVTDILQEIGVLADNRPLVSALFKIFLERAIDSENNSGQPFVTRILTAHMFILMSAPDEAEALDSTRASLKVISKNPAFTLDKIAATACQSLLFQQGGRCFQTKHYLQAADWFKLSADSVFEASSEANLSKCLRKTALCYIQAGKYALASDAIAKCPGSEAATRYVSFLCAAHQGLEDDAIQAIADMATSPDFDRKMLLLATKLAHEHKMRSLLLSILEKLLLTLQSSAALETEVEAMTLVRCMVRVIVELLNEPNAEMQSSSSRYFHPTYTNWWLFFHSHLAQKSASLITKDVSWLWRIVYNTAIEGCKSWDAFKVAELFSLAHELMLLYDRTTVATSENELEHYSGLALFSSICCRVFGLRNIGENLDSTEVRKTLRNDIRNFREKALPRLSQTQGNTTKLGSLVNLSFVLEVEQVCCLKQWGDLQRIMEASLDYRKDVRPPR
ncbi:hypothetical protein FRC01_002649 [Tulasnella sp. 417]|nr:hypothetical protein FRC01_002649 [Tulasnella sp. 417]